MQRSQNICIKILRESGHYPSDVLKNCSQTTWVLRKEQNMDCEYSKKSIWITATSCTLEGEWTLNDRHRWIWQISKIYFPYSSKKKRTTRAIGYFCRPLISKKRYLNKTQHKRLAVGWTNLSSRFQLEGASFMLRTDHHKHWATLNFTNVDGDLARSTLWLIEIYFRMVYKAWSNYQAAYTFSRVSINSL